MRIFKLLCLTLFVVPGLCAEFDASGWKFQAPVTMPASGKAPQFVRLTLPGWVLANAREDLLDLRIVNQSGTEIPYALRKAEARSYEEKLAATILNRGIDPGKFEQIVCDLGGQTEVSNQILLYTGARNFVRKADIAGSTDGEKWILLRTGVYIFHQHDRGRHHQNLLVTFPDSTYRYLKVIVWLDGGQPLDISGAEVQRLARTEVEPENLPATIVQRSEDTGRKTTDLIVETAVGQQHLEQCVLSVKQDNFERAVTVSYQNHRGAWLQAGRGTIRRFRIGPVLDESLSVPVQDLNQKRFRVQIWNEDNPALEVSSILMQRMPRLLIFSGSPSESYRLFLANSRAEARSYDLRGALERLEPVQLPEAKLGAMEANPSFSERRVEKPWTERHPALVWVALAAGVLLLGGLLLRTVRDVNKAGTD